MKVWGKRTQPGKQIPHNCFSFFSRAISCWTAIPTQTWATLFNFSARTVDAPSQKRHSSQFQQWQFFSWFVQLSRSPSREHWRFYGTDFMLAKDWNGCFQADCVSKESKSGGKCRGERTPTIIPLIKDVLHMRDLFSSLREVFFII